MAAQRSFLVRAIWFVFVGWWLALLAINVAWLLNVTVVLLPIGIKLINKVPFLLTLRRPEDAADADRTTGQRSLVGRGVYFVFVGWWASFLWANVAWLCCATVVGIPVGIWMFDRLPFVTSLYELEP